MRGRCQHDQGAHRQPVFLRALQMAPILPRYRWGCITQ